MDDSNPSPDEQARERRPARIMVQRRIEWWDTDASGVYHNTAAFRLLETAETLLLSRLGILHDVYHRLPRVRIEADFRSPLRFFDLVDVALEVQEIGRTSITYHMRIGRQGVVCVEAKAVAVLLDQPGGQPMEWPDRYRELLLTAGTLPPERLSDA